jgi:predicted ABC-type ATPase
MTVLAGPNGSGKTTMFEKARLSFHIPDTPFINSDIIARDVFNDWNNPKSQAKATIQAGKIRENFIRTGRSFMYETILTRIDFIERAKRAGFFVQMFYVATSNSEINIERVTERVRRGGHYVPDDLIRKRYALSTAKCLDACSLVDRAYVYDNSVFGENRFPELQFRVHDGRVKAIYQKAFPEWANKVLHQLPWDFEIVPE